MTGLVTMTRCAAGALLAAGIMAAGAARAEPNVDCSGPEARVDRLQRALDEEERAQAARAKEVSMTEADSSQCATEIRAVLKSQQDAWNRGDIDAFMTGYWKSDDLRFASGGSVTKGWQATIDRYKKRYSDREKMGRLLFSDLDVSVLSDDTALVFGRWTLERKEDHPTGLFSLLFRKIGGKWVIVHDHTSSE